MQLKVKFEAKTILFNANIVRFKNLILHEPHTKSLTHIIQINLNDPTTIN